jgi:hypothetical protein
MLHLVQLAAIHHEKAFRAGLSLPTSLCEVTLNREQSTG